MTILNKYVLVCILSELIFIWMSVHIVEEERPKYSFYQVNAVFLASLILNDLNIFLARILFKSKPIYNYNISNPI